LISSVKVNAMHYVTRTSGLHSFHLLYAGDKAK